MKDLSKAQKGGISIHAPLRGRRLPPILTLQTAVFQSTPPCGGDPPDYGKTCICGNFNPRPLAGATKVVGVYRPSGNISIHAPLRGRPRFVAETKYPDKFQSTPPCGGDSGYRLKLQHKTYFNPRPLAGATRRSQPGQHASGISIHAPLRGRPVRNVRRDFSRVISIHAPLRGRLDVDSYSPFSFVISIHAPLRGRR